MRKIILASKSPRRRFLLEQIGLTFAVDPSGVEEKTDYSLPPSEVAVNLSLQKAQAVAERYPDALIIAADTLVVFKGNILGKPKDEQEAREVLSELSGAGHVVITGLSLVDSRTGKTIYDHSETKVYFRYLSPREIDAYVATGEPLDKAGSYAIQGRGAALVNRIEGEYSGVVGLPLSLLVEKLKDFGINIW